MVISYGTPNSGNIQMGLLGNLRDHIFRICFRGSLPISLGSLSPMWEALIEFWTPGFWTGPASVVAGIWKGNHQMEDLCKSVR